MARKEKANKTRRRFGNEKGRLMTLVISGAMLLALVGYVILSANISVAAYVPSQTIKAGTTITPAMIKKVNIPAKTPAGYITDPRSLVNQKLKIDVQPNELVYSSNVQTNINLFGNDVRIPKGYIITNLQIPDEQAVGGILSTGDSVDIAGVPNPNYQSTGADAMKSYLGGMGNDSFGTSSGVNGYWVLNNVKILQSTSSAEAASATASKSDNKNSDTSSNSKVKTAAGTYIVAVSYADYKKILIAQQYLSLYLSKVPAGGYNKSDITKGNALNAINNAQSQDKNSNK